MRIPAAIRGPGRGSVILRRENPEGFGWAVSAWPDLAGRGRQSPNSDSRYRPAYRHRRERGQLTLNQDGGRGKPGRGRRSSVAQQRCLLPPAQGSHEGSLCPTGAPPPGSLTTSLRAFGSCVKIDWHAGGSAVHFSDHTHRRPLRGAAWDEPVGQPSSSVIHAPRWKPASDRRALEGLRGEGSCLGLYNLRHALVGARGLGLRCTHQWAGGFTAHHPPASLASLPSMHRPADSARLVRGRQLDDRSWPLSVLWHAPGGPCGDR